MTFRNCLSRNGKRLQAKTEKKESVIHSVHITKIELHRGKEPECFYASGFISFEFMHSLCRTNYTEERRKSFNICNVPIYQKQGVYDMKIYQDPGIQTIYRKE